MPPQEPTQSPEKPLPGKTVVRADGGRAVPGFAYGPRLRDGRVTFGGRRTFTGGKVGLRDRWRREGRPALFAVLR